MQSTESLVTITFNTGLQRYGGDLYVGSMSILMSIMQLIVIPVNGITQGAQPIVSYNYGAGNRLRVKETVIRLVSVCLLGTLILAGVAIFCPGIYASMFVERCRTCCFDMPNHADFFLGHCDFWNSSGLSIDVSRIGTGEGFAFYRHAAENHPADSVGTHLAKIFRRERHLHCRTGF